MKSNILNEEWTGQWKLHFESIKTLTSQTLRKLSLLIFLISQISFTKAVINCANRTCWMLSSILHVDSWQNIARLQNLLTIVKTFEVILKKFFALGFYFVHVSLPTWYTKITGVFASFLSISNTSLCLSEILALRGLSRFFSSCACRNL